ncbi:MAG: hypothetical protein GC159_07875 [Phycisphaera sp.]|nr:hypothetical protein [Phycisphaera sp.]
MVELLAQTASAVDPKTQHWAMVALGAILLVIVFTIGTLVIRSITRSVRRNYLAGGGSTGDGADRDVWSESAQRVRVDDDPVGHDDDEDFDPGRH